jgi:predicted ATP-grasp superfamily ATP-dependent carboligase
MRVLIAGVSTRAAAESAARAGFEVTALDAFGDLDQHHAVRALSLPRDFGRRFTADAAARASREVTCDAVTYLSSFENHTRAVTTLSAGRTLWGNPPDVLRRVRDPFFVAGSLRRKGFATPITRVDVPGDLVGTTEWLLKPFRSGGGQGVRRWQPGTRVRRGDFAQELIDGIPASIVFVAAHGRAVPLGLSRQLIGEDAFSASGYRYCGNILSPRGDADIDVVVDGAYALAQAAAEAFDLVGVNGIDFIVRGRVPYAIEVNPRWSSSMELVERAYGISVFDAHAAACARGELPAFDLTQARGNGVAHGKAILFARAETVVGDTRFWFEEAAIRDVPTPGERIATGQPVCTIFAQTPGVHECRTDLMLRAQAIYLDLSRPPRVDQHQIAL